MRFPAVSGCSAQMQVSPKLSARLCILLVQFTLSSPAILTVKTLLTIKKSGKGYFRENLLFWTRRISGFALIIDEAYRLVFFHSGRLISQILLAACLALHIIMNIRPMLIGMGAKQRGLLSADICFVLSVVFYYSAAVRSAFTIFAGQHSEMEEKENDSK